MQEPAQWSNQFTWQGISWECKTAENTGPGGNQWNYITNVTTNGKAATAKNVWVDNNGLLNLAIIYDVISKHWVCPEVRTVLPYDVNQTTVVVSHPLPIPTMDTNAVFGSYLLADDTQPKDQGTNELDFELGTFAGLKPNNGNFTVWPVWQQGDPAPPADDFDTYNFSFYKNQSYSGSSWASSIGTIPGNQGEPPTAMFFAYACLGNSDDSAAEHTTTAATNDGNWTFSPIDGILYEGTIQLNAAPIPMLLHLNYWLTCNHPPTCEFGVPASGTQPVVIRISGIQCLSMAGAPPDASNRKAFLIRSVEEALKKED